jgi:hypothetical protein
MNTLQQRMAAENFVKIWRGRGDEDQDTYKFWYTLIDDVLGRHDIATHLDTQRRVKINGSTKKLDIYIPDTKVLVEQKSLGVSLLTKKRQSDGTELTPYEQAKRYADNLPNSERPRWIVVCDFEHWMVYDLENPTKKPYDIFLEDLPKETHRLRFFVDANDAPKQSETDVSIEASQVIGELYDALRQQCVNPNSELTLMSLNRLCVRLVFCVYAEDSNVFPERNQFLNYMRQFPAIEFRPKLIELFRVLNTPEDKRDPYMRKDLLAFPYVNGGLFQDEDIEIPEFTDEIRDILLTKVSEQLNWSEISPTIFSALFESTLDPKVRRESGIHYTSFQNIHRVIDRLFLNDLKRELNKIALIKDTRRRNKLLQQFQIKLSKLRFIDPACGGGNFLTETFTSLRRLENEAIELMEGLQLNFDLGDLIKVKIDQFYGIEINDFAMNVAQAAFWIAESQMLIETERIVQQKIEFLPLHNYAHIVCANAMRMDWKSMFEGDTDVSCIYIIGNPPYKGYTEQTTEQKQDVLGVFCDNRGRPLKSCKKLDYVACWYYRAAEFMMTMPSVTAFVSTNGIVKGEQAYILWQQIRTLFSVEIDFAYADFSWESQVNDNAQVTVVIVGFHAGNQPVQKEWSIKKKIIVRNETDIEAKHINEYLKDGPFLFVGSRKVQPQNVPLMKKGSQPTDDGNFLLTEEERKQLLAEYPEVKPYVRRFVGADEYINKERVRYCLWLCDASPLIWNNCPVIKQRISKVAEFRQHSAKAATRKWAKFNMLFTENRQPKSTYLIIPSVSSEKRAYVPMGFLPADVIASNLALTIDGASKYHFGVLTSSVHMAWMRLVCGRKENRYRYSVSIVYNSFPWPDTRKKHKIELTADKILKVRELHSDCSLASLYDETAMPPDLRQAHLDNDKAVLSAYGLKASASEDEILKVLIARYQSLYGIGS